MEHKKRTIRTYTDEFREQMVSLYEAGKPAAEICREYDIPQGTFSKWHNRNKVTDKPYLAKNRTEEDERVLALEKENRQLRMENDILKQAALIFARRS